MIQPNTLAQPQRAPSAEEIRRAFRGPPQRRIDVGHSCLAYRKFGAGPDVLFVHGWPLHSATFRHVLPYLAQSMCCHLIDLPGTGQTEWNDDAPIGLEAHAQTLSRVVDALELERYALLAHDSGGAIARMLAARDKRVSGLVLGNTEIPGHSPALVELFAVVMRLPGGAALFQRLLASAAVRSSSLGFAGCFANAQSAEGEFRDLFVDPIVGSRRALRGHLALLKALPELRSLAKTHARITAPVRLIWGDRDPFFPWRRHGQCCLSSPVELSTVVIEGAKLFAHEDFSEAVCRVALGAFDDWFER